jgi:phage baseplate assembly protein W
MVKPVVTDPDTFRLSKLPTREIEMVRQAVEKKVKERTVKARQKWEEVVTLDEVRYGAACQETSANITIKKVRRLKGRKRYRN